MKHVEKSALVWYSPLQMFDLVTDVARYPEFLPWCDRSKILEHDDAGMTAEVGIAFSRIHQAFVTRNEHVKPEKVTMQLVKGPFSTLKGEWRFRPLATNTQTGNAQACKVELTLSYDFDNAALRLLIGPVFDKIANSMVEAFVKRADVLYGQ